MKKLTVVGLFLLFIGIIGTSGCIVWNEWWYPKTYEYALNLADDSSLPKQKASYIEEYLVKVSTISGPPRYVFTRPDLDLDKQKQILRGLIVRFLDIAKLDPKEMAYQQGMYQLTGQEMDHQLDRISCIFKDARVREGSLFIIFYCLLWPFWIVGIVLLVRNIVLWSDDYGN